MSLCWENDCRQSSVTQQNLILFCAHKTGNLQKSLFVCLTQLNLNGKVKVKTSEKNSQMLGKNFWEQTILSFDLLLRFFWFSLANYLEVYYLLICFSFENK